MVCPIPWATLNRAHNLHNAENSENSTLSSERLNVAEEDDESCSPVRKTNWNM